MHGDGQVGAAQRHGGHWMGPSWARRRRGLLRLDGEGVARRGEGVSVERGSDGSRWSESRPDSDSEGAGTERGS
eukprot:7384673-Prymnesium_polylepis.1